MERREDIALIARYFVQRFKTDFSTVEEISDKALERMERYDWPGNVRELENVIRRAIAQGKGKEKAVEAKNKKAEKAADENKEAKKANAEEHKKSGAKDLDKIKEKAKENKKDAKAKGKEHKQQIAAFEKQLARENAKHLERVARLERIKQLAGEKDNTRMVEKVNQLLEKEQKRHDKKLAKINQRSAKASGLSEKGEHKDKDED